MRNNTIRKTIYGAYAHPVPLAVRLEKHSAKGNIKQAWNIYTTPGKYRINEEMRHTVKRHTLPPIVYTWADMINAIITPAGGDLFTVDTPESLDTMTAADLVALASADMVEIAKRYAERGETI